MPLPAGRKGRMGGAVRCLALFHSLQYTSETSRRCLALAPGRLPAQTTSAPGPVGLSTNVFDQVPDYLGAWARGGSKQPGIECVRICK